MKFSVIVLLASVTGTGGSRIPVDKSTTPAWACSLADAPAQSLKSAVRLVSPTGFLPADGAAAENELTDAKHAAEDALKLDDRAHVENRTDAQDAASDEADSQRLIKDAKREMKEAQTFVAAVKKEMQQKVKAVNGASLTELLKQKKDLLVVFYAPWCGHCKTFVLHDDAGNPEKAPLEILNQQFVAANGPQIVKFDVNADRAVPKEFDVQFIPTVYMVSSKGEYKKFGGDPHDSAALKSFAGVKAESKVMLQTQIPEVPSWACSLAASPSKKVLRLGSPSGSLAADEEAATAEMTDAQNAAADAEKLASRAQAENKTDAKDAAQDEADASHLFEDAAREMKDVQTFVTAVKSKKEQKVKAVNGASLTKLIEEKKDLLVVFYAPWCGHCKTFVLHDESGNPENAPLEILNQQFIASQGPMIVKFDVNADRAVPKGFDVQFIPTVYMVTSKGEYKKFGGDPHDAAALKKFAGVKVETKVMLMSQAPKVPLWACSLSAAPQAQSKIVFRLGAPTGSLAADEETEANQLQGELKDAKDAAADAAKLEARAHAENKTDVNEANADEADAAKLSADAAKEMKEVQSFATAVKQEGEQKVTAVNGASLTQLLEKKEELLIVFYAPWCGHCKTFVLHDDAGNPEKAPLEILNQEFIAAKGPKVVKFDVNADRAIPKGFDVQFIPTVYMVTSKGEYKKFGGDPHDTGALKKLAGI